MAYSDKVIDHYENPRNVGAFGKDEEGVGTGMVGAPACGDVMKLQIRVGKAGISESLVRLSVGVENVDLLIEDLEQALERI